MAAVMLPCWCGRDPPCQTRTPYSSLEQDMRFWLQLMIHHLHCRGADQRLPVRWQLRRLSLLAAVVGCCASCKHVTKDVALALACRTAPARWQLHP